MCIRDSALKGMQTQYANAVNDLANNQRNFAKQRDNYLLAGPEKALCDKLYSVSPLRSRKALRTWLFENMRIEEEDFRNLSTVVLNRLSKLYASTNLKLLADALTRKGL